MLARRWGVGDLDLVSKDWKKSNANGAAGCRFKANPRGLE
jgi:hypothetical protein